MKWKQLPYDGPEYDESQDTLIRQSTIGQMQLCPGRVGFSDHPEYLGMISEPLAFGTCVHHIIAEDLLNGGIRDDLLLSMNEWVEEILIDQYDWSLERVPDVQGFFSEVAVAYRSWRQNVYPNLPLDQVMAIEEEFRMFLGEGLHGNIFLKGTADLVLESTLMDWKTSGRAWKQAKADFSVQASLYMPLHKQALDHSLQKFTFWVFNRSGGIWSPLSTKRTVAQIDGALATALQYGRQLESGAFPCTPVPEASFNKARGWYCKPKFCGAWNICDAKHLNDGFNEKEVAERSW
jgi:hypothetical protein